MNSQTQIKNGASSDAVELERMKHEWTLKREELRQEFDGAENKLKLDFERDKAA